MTEQLPGCFVVGWLETCRCRSRTTGFSLGFSLGCVFPESINILEKMFEFL